MDADHARFLARAGGVLYLIIIAIGAAGEAVVRGSVVTPGNATATAENLRSMESLWRLGVAGEVLLLSCGVALGVILYWLLRPVNAALALLVLAFNVLCIAIEGAAAVALAAAILPVTNSAYASAPVELTNAMSILLVQAHGAGFGIALIFFGLECLILGWLIFRSGYMPKSIGILIQVAGACYLVNSFAFLLSPALQSRLFPAILLPAFVGELSLALWLVVRGVRSEEWVRRLPRTNV